MARHQPYDDVVGDHERLLGLYVERMDEQLQIFRMGTKHPVLTQHARRDMRPYVHPILAPDGVGEVTEDGTGMHHPWQHGLFIGLNNVNGVGFWTEEAGIDGTFHPRPLAEPDLDGNTVHWLVSSEWRSPGGAPMVDETQAWLFRDQGTEFLVDLSWMLRGLVDLVFGQYAYGGLYLRSSYRPHTGARVLNSEGEINLDADGKRARWAAVELATPGGMNAERHSVRSPFWITLSIPNIPYRGASTGTWGWPPAAALPAHGTWGAANPPFLAIAC